MWRLVLALCLVGRAAAGGGDAACAALEQRCWTECGQPLVFPFAQFCRANDTDVTECVVPPGCTCAPCASYEPRCPAEGAEWPLVARSPGNLPWCEYCANNCTGSLDKCIGEGLCSHQCHAMQMCARFREAECLPPVGRGTRDCYGSSTTRHVRIHSLATTATTMAAATTTTTTSTPEATPETTTQATTMHSIIHRLHHVQLATAGTPASNTAVKVASLLDDDDDAVAGGDDDDDDATTVGIIMPMVLAALLCCLGCLSYVIYRQVHAPHTDYDRVITE